MATTWTPIASVVQTTAPNDLTGNSLSVAPVSGDTNAVAIKLGNGSTTLFSVNASGNIAAAASAIVGNQSVGGNSTISGNETVSGSLTVNGGLTTSSLTNTGSGTAAGLYSSIAGTAAAPSIGYSAQTDTGVYLATTSTSSAILAIAVNGVQALALSKAGVNVPGTLGVTGTSTLAGLSATSITDSGTLNVSGASTLASLSATSISAASLTLSGNLTVNGSESIAGTSTIAGLLTANGNITTPLVTTSQAATAKAVGGTNYVVSNVSFPGSFGDGSAYPPSGVSSDSLGNLLLNYQGVPAIRMANPGYSSANGNSPSTAYPTQFLSGSYAFNVAGTPQLTMNSSAVKFGYTSNTIPVTMQAFSGNILQLQNGGSSPSFTTQTVGTVDTSGNATFAGVIKGTSVTFGDGTSQTTAYTQTAAANLPRYYANSNGTTALPAFTYNANTDTGEYLKTSSTTAAVLGLSVNATDAMTLTKAGVTVPGTLGVTGAASLAGTLSVTGATNVAALTGSGLLTAPNVTLTSGGKITFGDGTTQTTAAAASAAGSSASFTATSNGSVSAPSFLWTNQTDTGMYLNTASTSAAVIGFTANATLAATLSKTAAVFNTTLSASTITATSSVSTPYLSATSTSAQSVIQGLLQVNKAVTFGSTLTTSDFIQSSTGSASAPAYRGGQDNNTGLSFQVGILNVSANGVQVCKFASGATTLTGTLAASGTVTSTTAAGTASFVSTQGFKTKLDMGHYYTTSSTTTAANTYRTVCMPDGTGPTASAVYQWQDSAGSVTGIAINMSGIVASTVTVQLYKNGSAVSGATAATAQSVRGASATFAKGTYTFAAGDYLTAFVTFGTAGVNVAVGVTYTIELGA